MGGTRSHKEATWYYAKRYGAIETVKYEYCGGGPGKRDIESDEGTISGEESNPE